MTVSNKKMVMYHFAFWIFYYTFAILTLGIRSGVFYAYRETAASFSISILIFYMHYKLLWSVASKGKYSVYAILLGLLFAFNVALKYLVFLVLWPKVFHIQSSAYGTPTTDIFLTFSWQASTFLILSSAYWFAERLLRIERDERKSEKLLLENAALRAQINPHFLVNSLVHVTNEIRQSEPQAAEYVHKIMTYIQSSILVTDEKGMIEIEEEISALEALIHVYKRRFPGAYIRYTKSIPPGIKIAPHILNPFIENALKHGDFTVNSGTLIVSLELLEGSLHFSCYNKKGDRAKKKTRGIGLAYVRQQLESVFKGQYDLTIKEEPESFEVNLRIDNIAIPESYGQIESIPN